MISITTNLNEVIGSLVQKMQSVNQLNGPDRDKLLRMVASDTIANMHERIHVKGLDSNGVPFGEYSSKYLKIRKANGLTGNKIILRFEGQLEKLTIVANSDNKYSIGWISDFNGQKAEWMEKRFGKIYDLTDSERAHVSMVAEDFIKQLLES